MQFFHVAEENPEWTASQNSRTTIKKTAASFVIKEMCVTKPYYRQKMDKRTFKSLYVERDVSWMYFNERILQEARREEVPLLERLAFLGIYSNNLDEFFRVRVATLNRIVEYSGKEEHDRARQTLRQINRLNEQYDKQFVNAVREATEALKSANIILLNESETDEKQRAFIRSFYKEKMSGAVSPVWLKAIRQLNEAADDIIYLALRLSKRTPEEKSPVKDYALIELPVSEYGRFIQLPSRGGRKYLIYLDDVIRCCLPDIFPGMKYDTWEAYSFKFTKDAEMEIDTDLRAGLMQKIARGVKSRKRGAPIRLVFDAAMPKDILKRIMEKLSIGHLDTILPSGRYHNHKDLMKFPDCGRKELKFPLWHPIHKREFEGDSLLRLIRERDRFIHVPYHTSVSDIDLLSEAALSRDVKSIRTTLYRLAKDSKVIKALVCAARNGKKVTVVIELLARFDETSNIGWSKQMQEAGIHVIFGVEGLKIHGKVTHIGSANGDIAVVSTGNFHEGNACCYTDYLLMTARKTLVKEVKGVFDFIERPYLPSRFKELLVSPNEMRKKLLSLIRQEIRNHQDGKPAYILAKINHITDEKIIEKLYEAAAQGIKIELLVRGNCSMITGKKGMTENIRIHGIIDRYLEHSRILIFAHGGNEKYFIGSADWMPRNLDYRIEVMAPVYEPSIQKDLRRVIEYGMKDSAQGYIVDGSGRNMPVTPENGLPFRSQERLYKCYSEENR